MCVCVRVCLSCCQVASLAPVAITQPAPGVYVFDFGRNIAGTLCNLRYLSAFISFLASGFNVWFIFIIMIVLIFSGWAKLQLQAGPAAGTTVRLLHAEVVDASGFVIQQNLLQGQNETTMFIYSGQSLGPSLEFEPAFVYYGFRFIQVTGLQAAPTLSDIEAYVVHTDHPQPSWISFGTPNNQTATEAMLTRLQQATLASATANFYSVPTDCPTREKRGWLGAITPTTYRQYFYICIISVDVNIFLSISHLLYN